MNTALYACVHAAEFPAQALLRLRPDLHGAPIAVIEGRPPHEFVCSMNRLALSKGISPGMTRLDVEGLEGVKLLARSLETEAAARAVLLECVSQFSPRIEEAGSGASCAFVLDIAGTERLFGTASQLAERMRSALLSSGFRVSIAVSANFHAAGMKAAATRGAAIIGEGEEAAALANLPITSLSMPEDAREIFAMWGIRTLGELAALPETGLITRLGADARTWRELARGMHPHLFQPIEPEFTLREFCEFDTAVEEIDSLLFLGARMIDCLVSRAADRALSLALITAHMRLDSGKSHECVLRPAVPTADRKFLLKLLQLEIGTHPPQAAVESLELTAQAGRCGTVQLGLFTPQTPEPSRLDITLARIRAIVGDDRVGSPALEDTHRPASFHVEGFAGATSERKREPAVPRMALRRMRPPVPIRVLQHDARPAEFRDRQNRFEIAAAYGPWRTSGCWWSEDNWDLEEWDVLARRNDGSSVACLLVCDRARNEWRLEAFYD
ncbi:MAG TPA: DNA polymerase Y family protein [Bryobacteraceae bacterium]|nr:DNA polymerase Y family protein [Bryobacteraceae bacterium]